MSGGTICVSTVVVMAWSTVSVNSLVLRLGSASCAAFTIASAIVISFAGSSACFPFEHFLPVGHFLARHPPRPAAPLRPP